MFQRLSFAVTILAVSGHCLPLADIRDTADDFINEILDTVENVEVKDVGRLVETPFPDREGFFTGHRIPLELFPDDTLRRIELTSETTTTTTSIGGGAEQTTAETPAPSTTSRSLYVNSDDIRRGGARSYSVDEDIADQEIILGLRPETDTKYYETLTSIVPLY